MDLALARERVAASSRRADRDFETQRSRLAEERVSLFPVLRRLHERNHVDEALRMLIAGEEPRESY